MEQKAEYIWYNGNLVKWQEANVHVLTYGLHYATSAFEGIRIYNSRPFKAEEHYQRLRKSAAVCNIDIPYSDKDLLDATMNLIKQNGLENGYIRPITWLNNKNLILSSPNTYCEIAIAAWPSFYNGNPNEHKKNPLSLTIANWKKAPSNAFPNSYKTTASYLVHYLIKQHATNEGFDDALILDQDDRITEASTSNFFIIKDNELITPEAGDFLLGITRNTVIDIAKANGISVSERQITLKSLGALNPDAAFLTGTAIEIRPVSSINYSGKKFEFDTNNSLFNRLLKLFHEYVRQCVHK